MASLVEDAAPLLTLIDDAIAARAEPSKTAKAEAYRSLIAKIGMVREALAHLRTAAIDAVVLAKARDADP